MSGVSVDFDKRKNVIIYPYWHDEFGLSRMSNKFTKLEKGYDEKVLGEEILKCLAISEINEIEDKEQLPFKEAGKVKSWSAYVRKYETVIIDINDKGIWYIAKYRKLKDGSFGLEKGDEEKYSREYTEPLTAQQLGHIVLEMLEIK
jgi:hypothetical protein